MDTPADVVEKFRLFQAEQSAISALFSAVEPKLVLIEMAIHTDADRMREKELKETLAAAQKANRRVLSKGAQIVGQSRSPNPDMNLVSRNLDRAIKISRRVVRDLTLLQSQLDEILGTPPSEL